MPIALRKTCVHLRSHVIHVAASVAILAFAAGTALAQTFGVATMPPGTLNHTTGTAIAKVKDDVVYKVIETMAKNQADLIAVQPALRAFTPVGLYKNFNIAYHPGALKYFADNKIEVKTTR